MTGCEVDMQLRVDSLCEPRLTLGHPGSPEVQPVHRIQQQHLCLPGAAPWWEQLPGNK